MTRVALLTNLPAPYRLPFFKALSEHPDIKLRVFFCPDRTEFYQRGWSFGDLEFDNVVLWSWLPRLPRRSFWFSPVLFSHLVDFRPDVIIAWSSFAGILAALYGRMRSVPLILWSGGTPQSEANIDPFRNLVRQFLFKRTAYFLAYSEDASQYLQSLGVPGRCIAVLGNVTMDPVEYHHRVELHHPQSQELRRRRGWPSKIILAVGKLTEKKNYSALLSAYELVRVHVSDVALLMVGEGPQRTQLEEYCDRRALQDVFFIGAVSAVQMPLYYAIADLFAHPAKYDQWPQVVNEAMAAGLPVLASTLAGLPVGLIVDGVSGYMVDPNNPHEWSLMMKEILSDDTLATRMGKQSFEAICDYSLSSTVSIVVQTVKEAIATR